jgi:hypothetical protein
MIRTHAQLYSDKKIRILLVARKWPYPPSSFDDINRGAKPPNVRCLGPSLVTYEQYLSVIIDLKAYNYRITKNKFLSLTVIGFFCHNIFDFVFFDSIYICASGHLADNNTSGHLLNTTIVKTE